MNAIPDSSPLTLPSAPLGGPRYDTGMLYMLPLLALLTTLAVLAAPQLLWPVLVADLWLLGYHHVIATYTRTSLDGESFREHWKLNVLLPPAVLTGVTLIGLSGGAMALTTLYIHWQLFHYVRQSEGISKAYASRQGDRGLPNRPAIRIAFYLVPTVAFLTMAARSDGRFLNFPVWLPALPMPVLAFLWLAALASLTWAVSECVRIARRGQLSLQYAHYLLSHVAVFVIAYALIGETTISWLMANIWHNAQYLMFVWKANQQRFKGQVHPRAQVLSTLCKPRNLLIYVMACLTLTFVIYMGTERLLSWAGSTFAIEPILAAAILYQAFNFHHYIVDAIIWRRPKAHAATPTG